MTDAPRPLEPLAFPLWGSQLIEASAGTGKTFTISLLYLRLVLLHPGPGDSVQPPRTPEQILVVTFTEAATQELRSRIRETLALAARCFGQKLLPDDTTRSAYQLIAQWRGQFAQDEWPIHAQTLQTAAQSMDLAAISTIHGWCYRMLREHAFDSLHLFQQRLQTDGQLQRQQAVRDYWRRFYDPLSLAVMRRVAAFWKGPTDLDRALKPLMAYAGFSADRVGRNVAVALDPEAIFHAYDTSVQQRLEPLKQSWRQWVSELRALFAEADAQNAFNRQKFKKGNYTKWLDAITRWAEDPHEISLELNTGWTRLTPQGLAEVWLNQAPPEHPALAQTTELHRTIASLGVGPRAELLRHALNWVAAACQGRRRLRTELDFDDMLAHFAQALRGENGSGLAQAVRTQFPVALIDEFQDTDPLQYEIVDRIYGVAQNRPETCLVMIGDPKQAIYSFRQADIYTYLQARRDVQDRIYSLGRNFRSTPEMVTAVNTIFVRAESRPQGKGAFRFREDGQNQNPVPFYEADSQPQALTLIAQSVPVCPITWVVHAPEGGITKDQYLQDMARASAMQIAQWLTLADGQQMGFTDQRTAGMQPLAPRDIAVLVDNGRQASLVRKALAGHGLRSVYLSDKESVYETPQAQDVYRWLQACANPDDEALVRAALATAVLGLSIPDLFALSRNELDWETCLGQFRRYRDIWQRRGVLPMLRRLLVDFGISQRLLQVAEDSRGQTGERVLTDLLHLAELLQQASVRLEGPQALLQFFAQQLSEASGDQDGERRRLETDDALIRVVTIHKAKGLQYPVVVLPFASAARPVKPSDRPVKWHSADGQRMLAWDEVGDDILALADAERLAEDIRKLYVAFTRAEHLLWIGLAPIQNQGSRQSPGPRAIDTLLGLGAETGAAYRAALDQWVGNLGHHRVRNLGDLLDAAQPGPVSPASVPNAAPNAARNVDPNAAPNAALSVALNLAFFNNARIPTRQCHDGWAVSSYSGIKARASATGSDPTLATLPVDSPRSDNLEEMGQEPSSQWHGEIPPPPRGPLHRFPKGSEPGTFLHGLLEWSARQGFAHVVSAPEGFKQEVQRRCQAFGWTQWAEDLTAWMLDWMRAELPVGGSSLQLCSAEQAKPELEFWLSASEVQTAELDRLVAAGCLAGRPRKPLSTHQVNGMLKGFVDLIVVHQGRYFVVDYKSNWLGPTDADYTADALIDSILESRYELQYALYLLALHRLLRSRVAGYHYDQHVGGAAYFFLRGLHGPCKGVHFERPSFASIDALDRLFRGGLGGGS